VSAVVKVIIQIAFLLLQLRRLHESGGELPFMDSLALCFEPMMSEAPLRMSSALSPDSVVLLADAISDIKPKSP